MAPRKRARSTAVVEADTSATGDAPPRPTADEEAAARRVLQLCKEVKLQPPLVAPTSRPDVKVVACALALYFGEKFESGNRAKAAFGVGRSTDVDALWVKGKLPRLFEAKPGARDAASVYFSGGADNDDEVDALPWIDSDAPVAPQLSNALLLAARSDAHAPPNSQVVDDHTRSEFERGYAAGRQREREVQESARSHKALQKALEEMKELRAAVCMLKADMHCAYECVREQMRARAVAELDVRQCEDALCKVRRRVDRALDPDSFESEQERELYDKIMRATHPAESSRAEAEAKVEAQCDALQWWPNGSVRCFFPCLPEHSLGAYAVLDEMRERARACPWAMSLANEMAIDEQYLAENVSSFRHGG